MPAPSPLLLVVEEGVTKEELMEMLKENSLGDFHSSPDQIEFVEKDSKTMSMMRKSDKNNGKKKMKTKLCNCGKDRDGYNGYDDTANADIGEKKNEMKVSDRKRKMDINETMTPSVEHNRKKTKIKDMKKWRKIETSGPVSTSTGKEEGCDNFTFPGLTIKTGRLIRIHGGSNSMANVGFYNDSNSNNNSIYKDNNDDDSDGGRSVWLRRRTISSGSDTDCKAYLKEQLKSNGSTSRDGVDGEETFGEEEEEAGDHSVTDDEGKAGDDNVIVISDDAIVVSDDEGGNGKDSSSTTTTENIFRKYPKVPARLQKPTPQSWDLRTSLPDELYVALDCEMVGVGPKGRKGVLARCSIVDYQGSVIYDHFVRPLEPITDYRTPWSGIRPCHMTSALPTPVALAEIRHCLKDKIIVGHSVYHDFAVLGLNPQPFMVRDTASCNLLVVKAGLEGRGNGLKKLSAALLSRPIQVGHKGHCSVEDARATLDLFKLVRREWEPELYRKWGRSGLDLARRYTELLGHSGEDFLHDKFW